MNTRHFAASINHYFPPGCLDTSLGLVFPYGSLFSYEIAADGLSLDATFDETVFDVDILIAQPEPRPFVIAQKPFIEITDDELPI